LAAWTVTAVLFVAGIVGELPAVSLPLLLLANVLGLITVKRTESSGALRRSWLYCGALALLLAACATAAVGAGSTVLFDVDESPVVGFVTLATTNLLLAVLGWRALVRPGPRRAAVVGFLAIALEVFAVVMDVGLNMFRKQPDTTLFVVALYACVVAIGSGALVCIAALASFEPPPPTNVPGARVVDEG
jgi:hypothetical protein